MNVAFSFLCQNGMLGGGVGHGKSRLVELFGSGERSRQSERRLGSERYAHARLCHLREPGSGSEPRQHMEWYDGLNREQVKTVIEFAVRSVGKAPVGAS
jgi:hypothetical protein